MRGRSELLPAGDKIHGMLDHLRGICVHACINAPNLIKAEKSLILYNAIQIEPRKVAHMHAWMLEEHKNSKLKQLHFARVCDKQNDKPEHN